MNGILVLLHCKTMLMAELPCRRMRRCSTGSAHARAPDSPAHIKTVASRFISNVFRCSLQQEQRPERLLRAASRRGGMAPKAAATAIEAEEMVDKIEGSLLRPDIDDPKRCPPVTACCAASYDKCFEPQCHVMACHD